MCKIGCMKDKTAMPEEGPSLTVRVSPVMLARIERAMEVLHWSKTQVVRECLEIGLPKIEARMAAFQTVLKKEEGKNGADVSAIKRQLVQEVEALRNSLSKARSAERTTGSGLARKR